MSNSTEDFTALFLKYRFTWVSSTSRRRASAAMDSRCFTINDLKNSPTCGSVTGVGSCFFIIIVLDDALKILKFPEILDIIVSLINNYAHLIIFYISLAFFFDNLVYIFVNLTYIFINFGCFFINIVYVFVNINY